MLSPEKPLPDLPCRKSIISDGRISDVDLLKSRLDDEDAFPKFSIRDYVSSSRRKDFKTNWPFSLKTLQLCLKNGVSNVLPPFQSFDSLRNHSNNTADTENNDSSKPAEDKESSFGINYVSLLNKNSLSSVPEAQSFRKNPEEKIESSVFASNKVKSSVQTPVKKCKVIVKLSKTNLPASNEALAVNSSVLFEPMNSKVCPVCKTFSFSSNTTLNAHIDQCLSRESTIKWTTNVTESKHRIKPRKTRLMDDIYATSRRCTLEDLDQRNGTNWASNFSVKDKEVETYSEAKNDTFSRGNEEENDDCAVYFDSNGTKLCILSKLNDESASSILREDQASKLCSKKKYLLPKQKLLKCTYGQRSSSSAIDDDFQKGAQERRFSSEKVSEGRMQPLEAYDHRKLDFGTEKRWVSGKRTCLKKITPLEPENPQSKSKKLGEKSSPSASKNRMMKRSHDSGSPNLSNDLVSLNLSYECKESVSTRNRMGLTLEPPDCGEKKNRMMSSKNRNDQSRDFCNPINEHNLDQSKDEDSLRKNLPHWRRLNAPESAKRSRGRYVHLKKLRLQNGSKSDEEAQVLRERDNSIEKLNKKAARTEKFCAKLSFKRTGISEIGKTKDKVAKTGKEGDRVSNSEISADFETHCAVKEIESRMINNVLPLASNDDIKNAEEHTSNIAEGGTLTGFRTSPSSLFPALTSSKEFYADKADEDMITHSTDILTEMNTDKGSYFVDVDTIAIPGPPGSFLPSPGRLSSEDVPGSSSLTNCRLQSSDEVNAFVNMDSSDSPVSSKSILSVSDTALCDSVSMQVPINGVRNLSRFNNPITRFNDVVDLTMPFESTVLQRSTSSSSDLCPKERMGKDLKEELETFHSISETFPMNGSSKLEESFSVSGVFYGHSEANKAPTCISPNQSAANPILRLMGKDLMVVNKDETASRRTEPVHSCMSKNSSGVPSGFDSVVSLDKIRNMEYSLSSSLENLEYVGRSYSINERFGSKIGSVTPLMFDSDQNVRKSPLQLRAADFPRIDRKRYVIDDSKGSEAGSADSFSSYHQWDHNRYRTLVDMNLIAPISNGTNPNLVMDSSSLVSFRGSRPSLLRGILGPSQFT